jgi:hypothetical protein
MGTVAEETTAEASPEAEVQAEETGDHIATAATAENLIVTESRAPRLW